MRSISSGILHAMDTMSSTRRRSSPPTASDLRISTPSNPSWNSLMQHDRRRHCASSFAHKFCFEEGVQKWRRVGGGMIVLWDFIVVTSGVCELLVVFFTRSLHHFCLTLLMISHPCYVEALGSKGRETQRNKQDRHAAVTEVSSCGRWVFAIHTPANSETCRSFVKRRGAVP